MSNKNFCLYPFAAYSIDNAGKTRICCNNDGWNRVALNKSISDSSYDLQHEYNNPFHKEVRQYFLKDERHPSCKKCWEIEDQGKISWRQWFNDSFKNMPSIESIKNNCLEDGTINNVEFLYLDITFGNKCNLKCVMCNGYNSTLVLKEELETKIIDQKTYNSLIKLDWYNDPTVFDKLYLFVKNVQRIHIVGGEPLIIEHQDFLRQLIKMGISKNIVLSYNSNLTKLPSDILACWGEFKKIYLCVSVDAYNELNEFIRFPMKWDKLIENLYTVDEIAKIQGNVCIQIHATFSAFNVPYFITFLDWVKEITTKCSSIEIHPMFNYVYAPHWADPIHLPLDMKYKALQEYTQWEKDNSVYLQSFGSTERFDMLKSYYTKINSISGNSNYFNLFLERVKFYEQVRNTKYPTL